MSLFLTQHPLANSAAPVNVKSVGNFVIQLLLSFLCAVKLSNLEFSSKAFGITDAVRGTAPVLNAGRQLIANIRVLEVVMVVYVGIFFYL